jgi:hypothetical protein
MNSLSRICIAGVLVFGGSTRAGAPDLETAICRLENWRREYTSVQLKEWCNIISSQAVVGDESIGKRLYGVIANEGLHISVRAEALRVALEKAGEHGASELVLMFGAWCLHESAGDVSDERARARAGLVWIVVTEGLRDLERAMTDQRPLLRLLTLIPKFRQPVLLPHIWEGIAENPAPTEFRRAAALQHIADFRDWSICPEPLVPILGTEALPVLRELVRQGENPEEFHYHAAACLAQLGDEEIVPDLEAWVPRLAQKHRRLGECVDGYIWKIKAQHPPEKLLEYVRSEGRRWPMQRALQLGIPKSEIRKALLEYADDLKARGKKEDLGQLIVVKHDGLKLGVLGPEDLPDVKIPAGLNVTP